MEEQIAKYSVTMEKNLSVFQRLKLNSHYNANSTIKICKESGSSGEEEALPDVSGRDMNTWYFAITTRI